MARKSFRLSRAGGTGDWVTEMMKAMLGESGLDALSVTTEEAGAAVCKNIFPVVKKRIGFILDYKGANFEAALVDEITQGEGPIASLELLEKVKAASLRIKELTELVESQDEKMRELEANLTQANEFLDKVENVKEDALTAAEKCKEFAKKEEEKFPKSSKEFLEQLRLEVRDEVALEMAEQATAATAASNVETSEKEIQTDPVSVDAPPANTPEGVPVAPPPDTNQQLTATDRDLLRSCLDEMRSLASLLSGSNAFQQGEAAGTRRGVSLRNTCVGTSEGAVGGHHGNVYEHVPLTTLRLSPICRAPPERSDLGSTRSILLSAPLSPHGRLHLERSTEECSLGRSPEIGAHSPRNEATLAATATASGVLNRSVVTGETSILQDAPQQQTFVHSHLLSAELPEEVSVHSTPEIFPRAASPPTEGSVASPSLSRETSALKSRKSGASKAQGKLQISFADEPFFTSDPPGNPSSPSTVLNQTENAQQQIAFQQELSGTLKAAGLHATADATTPLPSEPQASASSLAAAAASAAVSAILNPHRGDTSAVLTAEGRERASASSAGKATGPPAPAVQQKQQQQQQHITDKRVEAEPQEPNSGAAPVSLSLSHASFAESLIADEERQGAAQGEKYLTQMQQRQQQQQQQEQQQPQDPQQEEEEQHLQQQEEQQPSMTRNNSFCVPPEAIFGQNGPPIWPMVTGGLSWCQSHETKTIPLARLQRQIRGEYSQAGMVPAEFGSTPLLIQAGKFRRYPGREQHCVEFAPEVLAEGPYMHSTAYADASTAVYVPLKGSKLGSGPRKPPKREVKQTPEATCKTLNDLRIRNQVLENQVLGLSVALRQAHERLNTLTRVCDKLKNGAPVQK
ncbi:hypothetical protein, conserved [Eimeria brunetti]|uniref:Uncharacterized protein n=1 Tax=Eimeria brunetti TaxID=51314 RepID=U6LJP5_9EIME|nr:hypothetical protein, conserved [Eimeria brunetti]